MKAAALSERGRAEEELLKAKSQVRLEEVSPGHGLLLAAPTRERGWRGWAPAERERGTGVPGAQKRQTAHSSTPSGPPQRARAIQPRGGEGV